MLTSLIAIASLPALAHKDLAFVLICEIQRIMRLKDLLRAPAK